MASSLRKNLPAKGSMKRATRRKRVAGKATTPRRRSTRPTSRKKSR